MRARVCVCVCVRVCVCVCVAFTFLCSVYLTLEISHSFCWKETGCVSQIMLNL